MSIPGIYNAISSVNGLDRVDPSPRENSLPKGVDSDFEKIFQEKIEGAKEPLKLSQHAQTRIRSREIPWSPDVEKRIGEGIDVASLKGSREALILADEVAVIANVESKTVVTAMDRTAMSKGKIFTNIDSTVLV